MGKEFENEEMNSEKDTVSDENSVEETERTEEISDKEISETETEDTEDKQISGDEKNKNFFQRWKEREIEKEKDKEERRIKSEAHLKEVREERRAAMYADGKEPNAIQKFLMNDGKYINYENKASIVLISVVIIGIIVFGFIYSAGYITKEKFGFKEAETRAMVYSKGNDLYCYDLKNEPVLISDSLSAGGSATFSYVGNGTTVAEDGRSVYFIDNVTVDGTFTLNYFDAKKKGEPVKIADNVADYKVSFYGDGIVYVIPDETGYTGTIYGYSKKTNKSTEISKDIFISGKEYSISGDGKKVIYAVKEENSLALKMCNIDGSDLKTIDTEIAQYFVTSNDNLAYYVKASDGEEGKIVYSIYKYDLKKGKSELIDEDIIAVTLTNDENAVIYYKNDGQVVKASDIIIDDCIGDAKYDKLRAEIDDYEFMDVIYSAYRYEDGKSTLITDKAANTIPMDKEGKYIAYTVPNKLDDIKINLSEVTALNQIPLLYHTKAAGTDCDIYVNKLGSFEDYIMFEDSNLLTYKNSDNNTQFACFKNYDQDKRTGQLVLANYSKKGVNAYSELEEDVESFQFLGDGSRLTYLRGVDETGSGTLMYVEANIPDEISDSVYYYEATDDMSRNIYYLDNYNPGTLGGTFHCYRQADDMVIDENVYMFSYRNNKNAFYMKDYDAMTGTGDLYYLKGKNAVLVDEDVSSVFDFYKLG